MSIILVFFLSLKVSALQCVEVFAKPTVTHLSQGARELTSFSSDGKWMLVSSLSGKTQSWILINLHTLQKVTFTTEAPPRIPFKQTVSFETDNIKIYTLIEGQYKSFYQFNHEGQQIGSPAIRRIADNPQKPISDFFFMTNQLRFYKHEGDLTVQTFGGITLGRIPSPEILSARTLRVHDSHLTVIFGSQLSVYQIDADALKKIKTFEISQITDTLAKNSFHSRIIKGHDWNFDPALAVAKDGSLIFRIRSEDLRHTIALISTSGNEGFQLLGNIHPRFMNRNFGFLNERNSYSLDHTIHTQNGIQHYTTFLRFYDRTHTLIAETILDGPWRTLWKNNETVVLFNEGRAILQAYRAEGTPLASRRIPRAASHPIELESMALELGGNLWLVVDSRNAQQHWIFDSNLNLLAQIQGKLLAVEESYGLFAIAPMQGDPSIAIYNRLGQQIAKLSEVTPFLQNIKFTSQNSLIAQDKTTAQWMQIRWP